MERATINGIPVKEVFQKLKEDIPGVIKMTDRREGKPQPYLDAAIQRQFFEKHVPPENYDFEMTDVQLVQMKSRACFVCTGTITVFDDQRQKVVVKSYTGSNNCIVSTASGEPTDLAMDARTAAVFARKGCISLFGCGERQLDAAKAQSKGNSGGNTQTASQQPAKTQGRGNANGLNSGGEKPATGIGKFRLVFNAQKKTKTFDAMVLLPVKCRDYRDYETVLLIWKNRHRDVSSIINRVETGIEFICEGKFEAYGNNFRIVLNKMDGILS